MLFTVQYYCFGLKLGSDFCVLIIRTKVDRSKWKLVTQFMYLIRTYLANIMDQNACRMFGSLVADQRVFCVSPRCWCRSLFIISGLFTISIHVKYSYPFAIK